MKRGRMTVAATLVGLLGGCAAGAPSVESVDRAECKAYKQSFQRHSGRMWDACMISRGYEMLYDTPAGWVEVKSQREPRQSAESVAEDLTVCHGAIAGSYASYEDRVKFANCMEQRGYAVRVR
jgi:hypothetical protein